MDSFKFFKLKITRYSPFFFGRVKIVDINWSWHSCTSIIAFILIKFWISVSMIFVSVSLNTISCCTFVWTGEEFSLNSKWQFSTMSNTLSSEVIFRHSWENLSSLPAWKFVLTSIIGSSTALSPCGDWQSLSWSFLIGHLVRHNLDPVLWTVHGLVHEWNTGSLCLSQSTLCCCTASCTQF